MISIGLLSILMACIGLALDGYWSMYSGLCYSLIGPALAIIYRIRLKRMKKFFTEEEINEVGYGVVDFRK